VLVAQGILISHGGARGGLPLTHVFFFFCAGGTGHFNFPRRCKGRTATHTSLLFFLNLIFGHWSPFSEFKAILIYPLLFWDLTSYTFDLLKFIFC